MSAQTRLKKGNLRTVPSNLRERCHETSKTEKTVRRCVKRAGHKGEHHYEATP